MSSSALHQPFPGASTNPPTPYGRVTPAQAADIARMSVEEWTRLTSRYRTGYDRTSPPMVNGRFVESEVREWVRLREANAALASHATPPSPVPAVNPVVDRRVAEDRRAR
jgi:hypothetical protein